MSETGDSEKLGGGSPPPAPSRAAATVRSIGAALLTIAQPDLFGGAAETGSDDRLAALRQRRSRTRRRAEAAALLAEPWSLDGCGATPDAVALARRFLRRHPDRDRADPAPPLLTARQEAALWHSEEETAEECFRRDAW